MGDKVDRPGQVSNNPRRGWLGASWVSVLALLVSGMFELAKWPGPFPLWSYIFSLYNIVPMLFIVFIMLMNKRRILILTSWLVVSSICLLISGFEFPWGDVGIDYNHESSSKFFAFSYLSDAMFAFGSLILFVAGVGLSWEDWRKWRRPTGNSSRRREEEN